MKALILATSLSLAAAGAAVAPPASDAPISTHDAPKPAADAPVDTHGDRPTARPAFDVCAGAYAALARHQDNFGTEGSLMSERYPNFARINFNERLAALARQVEKGVTELKADAQDRHGDMVRKLVDAETEGDLGVASVRDVTFVADSCDAAYGFSPSLGQ